jgi:2-polyprenyl-3-methyl-5-hydroxy-6-metoxy-1,4-benzoquinol methylase
MPLSTAHPYTSELPDLPSGPPYSCKDLTSWRGCSFWLEPTDPRLLQIHNGENASELALENLEGMVHYWTEHPEWMDMLNPNSPVYNDKIKERQLYIDFWGKYITEQARVIEIGAGVGRMTQWLLNNNCNVEVIEPDLRSIWRLVSNVGDGSGLIDIHWSTAEMMPDLGIFDIAVACEVLNYVENPVLCLQNIHNSLRPGGLLLLSIEARWGWAFSRDAAEDTLDAFLDTGIVHVENDRWIQTYTEEEIQNILHDFEIISIQPSHYSISGPFEMIVGDKEIEDLLVIEELLRNHPIAKNLNRAWMIVAQKRYNT